MRILVLIPFLVSCAIAQSSAPPVSDAPIRVCVGVPSNLSHLAITGVAERDRFIQQLNREGRKGKKKVEALPVPAGDLADIASAAAEHNCRLMVSLRFEESYGYVPRNIDPVSHQPPITQGGMAGTRRASLAYSIARVDDRGHVDEGGIPLKVGGDDDSAASDALSQIAPRVVHDAVKSKP